MGVEHQTLNQEVLRSHPHTGRHIVFLSKTDSLLSVQYNLIITLSLGSIDADRVISETVL